MRKEIHEGKIKKGCVNTRPLTPAPLPPKPQSPPNILVNEGSSKTMTVPVFCPVDIDTDADALARAIAGYLTSRGIDSILALPVAVRILASIQTYATQGIDAACEQFKRYQGP